MKSQAGHTERNERVLPKIKAFNLLPKVVKQRKDLLSFKEVYALVNTNSVANIVEELTAFFGAVLAEYQKSNKGVSDASFKESFWVWSICIGYNVTDTIVPHLVKKGALSQAKKVLDLYEEVRSRLSEYQPNNLDDKEASEILREVVEDAYEAVHFAGMRAHEKEMIEKIKNLPENSIDREVVYDEIRHDLDLSIHEYGFVNFFREFVKMVIEKPEVIDNLSDMPATSFGIAIEQIVKILELQGRKDVVAEIRSDKLFCRA